MAERERAVVEWHLAGPLAPFSEHALDGPRVAVLEGDLVAYLRESDATHDALCLGIDNGPDWTVTEDNRGLNGPEGLAACRARLTPGGALTVWSAKPSAAFEDALRTAGFTQVQTVETPANRGVPDVVHLATAPA